MTLQQSKCSLWFLLAIIACCAYMLRLGDQTVTATSCCSTVGLNLEPPFRWNTSLKWAIVVTMYFIGYASNRALEFKRDHNWPGDADGMLKALLEGQIVKTITLYAYTLVVTALFEREYDHWFVRVHWLACDQSLLSWSAAVMSTLLLILAFVITVSVDSRVSVYRASVAIVLEQLGVAAVGIFMLLLFANTVYCGVALYVVSWTNAGSLPGWLAVVFRIASVLSILLSPLLVYYIVAMAWPSARISLRSVAVLTHVVGPYFFPRRYLHVASLSPAPDYTAPPSDDDHGSTESTTILVVSDSHLAKPGMGVIDSSRPSSTTLKFIREAAITNDSALILPGDVTDRGDPEAWDLAAAFFKGFGKPLLVCPGNHDVHFKRVTSGLFEASSYSACEYTGQIAKLSPRPQARTAYPFVQRAPGSNVLVVVLDSNLRSSNTPITNAIGFVGEDQLVTAQVELNKIQSTTDVLLVLLHHHILLPSFSVENALLRCLDSDKVLSFAVKNKAAAVIHGHKHMPYVCQYCDSISGHRMLIVSCGSAHHDATGPFAGTIGGPSCYRLTFRGQLLAKVELIVDQDGAPARELVRVTVEQVEVVVPLFDAYRQFYGQPPDPDGARRFLAERLGRGDSVIFAVVEGGRALGFTQLYPSFSSVSMRPTWVLNDLFVAEDARRRGVGGQLLRAARDHAMKTGAARLALSTAVTNTKAQALYEREGWRRDTVFLHYEYELPKGGG